jgi:threonine aldolase
LALSQIAPPYGAIYCYDTAHIVTDECAAPEFFTGGARLLGLPSSNGKVSAGPLAAAIALANDMGVHHVQPAALSLTQATEWGTVYDLSELTSLSAVARQHQMPVHMDGARFANALTHLGCSAAEATWKSGIDVLSLGATKNGALCAEAVVFFDRSLAEQFERRRKRAGHLWSKLRFLSAQLLAYFEDDLWLQNARQANAMASRLAQGLQQVSGARLLHTVQANEVFLVLPEKLVMALEKAGFHFYRWPWCPVSDGVPIRLVTSYATVAADVDEIIHAAR